MVEAYRKNIFRTIRETFGRFIAIMAIIALGVGFYAGLKLTKPSLVLKASNFFTEHKLYDFSLISTIGMSKEDVEELAKLDCVIDAVPAYYEDICYVDYTNDENVIRAYAISDRINTLNLVEGRMPKADNECVIDAYYYDSSYIGTEIIVEDRENIKRWVIKVVGRVESPMFISNERGVTNLGQGRINGYMYLNESAFDISYYKNAYVICDDTHKVYSDEYKDYIDEVRPEIEAKFKELMEKRHLELKARYKNRVPELETYVLDRNQCVGYVTYSSDTDIVNDVAKIFPVFFFLIAALVCSTTMTRMVDDERGQIGTLCSLGYGKWMIMSKYLIYSGLAAGIGSIVGFFIGSKLFPYVIGHAYNMLYSFGGEVRFFFSPQLLVLCVIVSLICSMGAAYLACEKELRDMPAYLIRPKAPRIGKRILLERIGFIWNRMSFLYKVTARNIFRFKRRMFMMIIGIAGCQALVLAGFGIRDSISNIAKFQYDEIDTFDIEVTLKSDADDSILEKIHEICGNKLDKLTTINKTTANISVGELTKNAYLVKTTKENIDGFENITFVGKGRYPGEGEVILSKKIASMGEYEVGDNITLTDSENVAHTYRISGIFENYVWHYAYVLPDENSQYNTILIKCQDEKDAYEIGASIRNVGSVLSVTITPENKDRVKDMMVMLNAVVWLVIGSAGALAFIVLINLSNINITERVREIATIKVLGFYPNESGAYVFRENFVLSIMGILVGLPLGTILLRFVISQINVDMVSFPSIINPLSYVLGVMTVLLFTVIVDLIMRKKIEAINMTQALKSAE